MGVQDKLKRDAMVAATVVASFTGGNVTNAQNATSLQNGSDGAKVETVTTATDSALSSIYDATKDFTPSVNMDALKKAIQNSDNITKEDELALIDACQAIRTNPQDPASKEAFKMIMNTALQVTNRFVMADQYYDFSYMQNHNVRDLEESQKQWNIMVNKLLSDEGVRNNIPAANVINGRKEPVTSLSEIRHMIQVNANSAVYKNTEKVLSKEYLNSAMVVLESKNTNSKEYKEAKEYVDAYEKEFYLVNGVKLDFTNNDINREIVYNRLKYKEAFKQDNGGVYPDYASSQDFGAEKKFLDNPKLKDEVYKKNVCNMMDTYMFREGYVTNDVQTEDGKYQIPASAAEIHDKWAETEVKILLQDKLSKEDLKFRNEMDWKIKELRSNANSYNITMHKWMKDAIGKGVPLINSFSELSDKRTQLKDIYDCKDTQEKEYKLNVLRERSPHLYKVYTQWYSKVIEASYLDVAKDKENTEKGIKATAISGKEYNWNILKQGQSR